MPVVAVLRDLVRTEDRGKALFAVRSFLDDKRKGTACSVKTESGRVFLVTCTDVANPEYIGTNDEESLVADRFCAQYPKHNKKHRIKIQDIHSDGKFTFIPLSKADDTFPMKALGHKDHCDSLSVIGTDVEVVRVKWSYDKRDQKWGKDSQNDLGNSAILGSPVLWTNGNTTFVVGVVGSGGGSPLPIFFEENSSKITGKKDNTCSLQSSEGSFHSFTLSFIFI